MAAGQGAPSSSGNLRRQKGLATLRYQNDEEARFNISRLPPIRAQAARHNHADEGY
ncbi:MAG: hypothetical protein J2P41_03180 [Blastocatellia bacterium]|nr:hypothetical protein [Blastocatellia bacterium]